MATGAADANRTQPQMNSPVRRRSATGGQFVRHGTPSRPCGLEGQEHNS